MDYKAHIRDYIAREKEILDMLDVEAIDAALNKIVETFENEGTIYIFGNGGSASTASHFANDFNKGISEYTEKKFRFICLNDNVPTVPAIANDIGYEEVYRFQLRGKLNKNDLVIGITGYTGGKVRAMCDYSLHVPVENMQLTEDVHMIFDHMMMTILYQVWGIIGH
ncbi:MAG: SIS domain-containing protein [Clostridia bacterium]|nr:SIS domain-containing protein [Clostridia bacterium]